MEKYFVYILYSNSLERFYIGQTYDLTLRLERHNSEYYENKWTKRGIPWSLFFSIECNSKAQALKIERHIKRMKSKKYIKNLPLYPEITQNLLKKYTC